ncbi:MAG: CinA family protein [Burkholderiaceae bacterium]
MNDTIHSLAAQLGRQLMERNYMVTTAESCTGGLVAAALTDIAGSSAWFERGFVTYSNHAKVEMLGIAPDLIELHGAVSEDVARAMAEGALLESRAQLAVSITGIAGPGGGTRDKPVGTVCFGWVEMEQAAQSETMHFAGDRAQVREQSVQHALGGLLLRVLAQKKESR